MRNQKPISARINHCVLWRIDQEAMLGHYTRNAIINEGADLFCRLQDFRRHMKIHQDKDVRRKVLRGFLIHYAPEALDVLDQ